MSGNSSPKMLTRLDLAKRWATTPRTVDRRRRDGLIAWIDLAAGTGKRPQVRFRLEDVESYEQKFLQKPGRPAVVPAQ
jgi:hypothetical protein